MINVCLKMKNCEHAAPFWKWIILEGSLKNVGSKVSFAVVDQGEGPSLFF